MFGWVALDGEGILAPVIIGDIVFTQPTGSAQFDVDDIALSVFTG